MYDLLGSPHVPKSERAPAPRPPKPKRKAKPAPVVREKAVPESTKVVAFKAAPEEDDDEEIAEIKKQVQRAMAALEEGKAVAAFNLLKPIVGE